MVVKQKKRGKATRTRKKIILLGLEGKNVTKKQYFSSLNKKQEQYRVIFAAGNSTDPKGIVKDTIYSKEKNDLSKRYGDLVYCVFDTDVDLYKKQIILEANMIAQRKEIEVLLSNPTFEIWFLLHYQYTTKQFIRSEDVVKELQKVIPNYTKNQDVYKLIETKTLTAIENAKKLENYHKKNILNNKNPSTEVYKLVELLYQEK